MLVGKYESNATALRLALQYRWAGGRPLPLRRASTASFCMKAENGVLDSVTRGLDQQMLVR